MSLSLRRGRRAAVAAAVVCASSLLAVGCAPATPSRSGHASAVPVPSLSPNPRSSPSPSPAATPAIPGLSWIRDADVARPDEAFAGASAGPTVPTGPGTAGHPGHFPGQAIVDEVVQAGDRLIAVGYVGVRGVWTAIAWTSDGDEHWSLASIDREPGSFAVGLAVGPGAGVAAPIVAVGRSGPQPAAWDSVDGRTWTRRAVPALGGAGTQERIVTVLATDAGFVAGGSAGPELGDRRARFWRSPDGATWEPVPDDPSFAGAEVVAIHAAGRGLIAIGRLGTGQRATGSVAWISADGLGWRRIESPDLTAGLVASLATAPDGSLVAVGSDLDERAALVWRSTDGTGWSLVPIEESRLYHGAKIRMTDVAPIPAGGLVAVGNYVGLQYGTATSWTSSDGLSWRRAPDYPALGQGEMLGVAAGRSQLIAVGSFGAPDNYIPTIWHSPAAAGN